MRQNPHVRICGGLGSATTLVYPTADRRRDAPSGLHVGLRRLADADLVRGKTVGIDATTLEANAALRSIVRRDTGESYETFLHGLAAASGIPTPTRAELARLDRKRPKKGSNDDWTHPQDPDAKITKMKDGRTHLAHKAEQAVDLETGAVVGVRPATRRRWSRRWSPRPSISTRHCRPGRTSPR